jgi:hypothetical protein
VRAASESDAREVTPAVLGAPGSDVVRPADQANFIAAKTQS